MASDRKTLLERAQFAESAERYDDMVIAMKQVVVSSQGLTKEERNLFSVAYKNAIGARRSSWRVLSSLISKYESERDDRRKNLAESYRAEIEKEIIEISEDVIQLLDKYLIKPIPEDIKNGPEKDKLSENMVFCFKMKGDYNRYVVEVTVGDNRAVLATKAENAYKEAYDTASKCLPSTDPIRLGVSLNYSVFFYEIKNDGKKACQLAKEAFDNAVAQLDSIKEDAYKESTQVMQLLRDNFTLWSSRDESNENK